MIVKNLTTMIDQILPKNEEKLLCKTVINIHTGKETKVYMTPEEANKQREESSKKLYQLLFWE